jgi:hypothetical protein
VQSWLDGDFLVAEPFCQKAADLVFAHGDAMGAFEVNPGIGRRLITDCPGCWLRWVIAAWLLLCRRP